MANPLVRTAIARDAASIRVLLELDGLPTADLVSSEAEFVVACQGMRIIGAGALQRFGAAALLRSVVVEVGARGAGVGHLIIQELERRARAADVTELILLTQTAKPFFERQNYRTIERASVPPAVQASEEFRSLCPESATCMAKTLR
jgi:amino-acid N-acetyltransferase